MRINFSGIGFSLFLLLFIFCPKAQASSSELFISEYIEGTSNNKAVEIYNPSASPIDLTPYKLELYMNGASTPNYTINLEATISGKGVFVVCNSSFIDPPANTLCNLKSGNIDSNGDDTIVLKNGETILDVFGQIGFDPGTSWGNFTQDHTLVRKCSITSGDQNGTDVFDPTIEWDIFPVNDFSYLGNHSQCLEPSQICGNEIMETGEDCDDGNNTNGDGCDSSCKKEIPEEIPGSISGFTFYDRNRNGTWDGFKNGEIKLGDWKIVINKKLHKITKSSWSKNPGSFTFEDLPAGNYSVCEIPKFFWQTPPCQNISLANGENITNLTFGNYLKFWSKTPEGLP